MKNQYGWLLVSVVYGLLLFSCSGDNEPAFKVRVEAEETVYKYEPPNKGSGPMWCHGNTCIVRYGEKLVASGMETLEDQVPLNNTRWMLFERTERGWDLLIRDVEDRTREPSPLDLLNNAGRVMLSVNPALTGPGIRNGPAEPRILQFDAADILSNLKRHGRIINSN
jgi:hypothetical protein